MAKVGYCLTGGLVVFAATAALLPSKSMADALTRSGCWVYLGDAGDKRTLCFFDRPRVAMTNYNYTTDHSSFSTCKWSGNYSQSGDKITITFPQNSGKCSNGASSPETTAVCDFSGDSLSCQGSTIIDGKTYKLDLVFK
jgi:hypothetical protein